MWPGFSTYEKFPFTLFPNFQFALPFLPYFIIYYAYLLLCREFKLQRQGKKICDCLCTSETSRKMPREAEHQCQNMVLYMRYFELSCHVVIDKGQVKAEWLASKHCGSGDVLTRARPTAAPLPRPKWLRGFPLPLFSQSSSVCLASSD